MPPREHADRVSDLFRKAWSGLDVSYDRFVRTTEPAHARSALALWERIAANGDLYRGVYEGYYCAPCEAYYEESELDAGRCLIHQTPCERQREENTFFRLSRYREPLERLLRESDFLQPRTRRAELLGLIRAGLRDVSLTRRNLQWGIPTPGRPGEVLYVFGVDALSNYLTGLDFPEPDNRVDTLLPRATHLIGKEIQRFHCLYWPAFLLSAGLPLPRRVVAHGWFTVDGEKISKTRGNAVDPLDLVEAFGVDAVRYGLLRLIPFGGDGDFSREALVRCWNADLAGGIGNLAQRLTALVARHCGGSVPEPGSFEDLEGGLRADTRDAVAEAECCISDFALDRALAANVGLVRKVNRYLERREPWVLARHWASDRAAAQRLRTTLYCALQALRTAGLLLAPVAPRSARRLADRLGFELAVEGPVLGDPDRLPPGTRIAAGPPLFPRLPSPISSNL